MYSPLIQSRADRDQSRACLIQARSRTDQNQEQIKSITKCCKGIFRLSDSASLHHLAKKSTELSVSATSEACRFFSGESPGWEKLKDENRKA
jgi:hypothetical protein